MGHTNRLRTIFIQVAFCLTALFLSSCRSHSEKALHQFYENTGPEETLMDPLILAGEKVVPLVVEKVRDKSMPNRRYAIAFLGNGSYRQALPVLESILLDTTEESWIRSDALIAIYRIDSSLAGKYLEMFKTDQSTLGQISRGLSAGNEVLPPKRSYSEALTSQFDR